MVFENTLSIFLVNMFKKFTVVVFKQNKKPNFLFNLHKLLLTFTFFLTKNVDVLVHIFYIYFYPFGIIACFVFCSCSSHMHPQTAFGDEGESL